MNATVLPMPQPSQAMPPDELRNRVKAAIAAGMKQAQVAKEADLTAPVLSQWLQGKYPGDNQTVEVKLSRWLATRGQAEEVRQVLPELPDFVETPTARRILGALIYAQTAEDIAVIYGGAGLGKTSTIRHYRETNSSVWVVTATPASAQVGPLLDRIATMLGITEGRRDPATLEIEIIKKLTGSRGLLVIDEAQHLTNKALETVRSIHDATAVGLVLSGNAQVYAQLHGGSRADNFAQLFSRIGKQVRLVRAQDGDVAAIAREMRVHGAEEIALLKEIATKPGGLRQMVKVLRQACMYAAGRVPPVDATADDIRAAYAELSGERTDA